ENSHLEAWGPFGRGWELERFSAQVTSPYSFPVIAYPKAWSPGFGSQVVMPVAPVAKGKKNKVATPAAAPSTTITADVVYLDAHDEAGLAKYKGQLKGKIVFMSGTRELKADFEGMGHRYNAQELLDMANAPDPDAAVRAAVPANSPNQANMQDRLKRFIDGLKRAKFVIDEGAAMVVDNSFKGSGGTIFVSAASVAADIPANPMDFFSQKRLSPWDKEAEAKMVPQMTMATEDYNRIVR